jgi:glycosyltransferase involved in cell wall biosynthesis
MDLRTTTAASPSGLGTTGQLLVAIPVFNDWESLNLLLKDLDGVLHEHRLSADVLIVDDGSTILPPRLLPDQPVRSIGRIEILHLRRNLGHQRAIAIGLAFIHSARPCGAVLIMDGDGEDRPGDVISLLDKYHEHAESKIIFAERTKRSESLPFRTLYFLYRMLHRMLTGLSVRVGNFSIIPFQCLTMLVVVSDLWNHYAAAVFKARVPYATVPTTRGHRLAGTPTMDFVGLVVHGLSALSVFGDIIGVRLLAAAVAVLVVGGLGIIAVAVTRFATSFAIPGWATYTSGLLFLLLFQTAGLSLLLIFIILSARATVTFIPIRDYQYFVKDVTEISAP